MGVLYARVGGVWQEVVGGTGGGGGGGPATPTGPAGGDIVGTYPDALQIASGAVGTAEIAAGAVGLGHLSATGTKNTTTFLRGDNTFAVPSSGGTNPTGPAGPGGDLTGNYPGPSIAAGAVNGTKLASGVVGMAHLSATGTKDASTFLRGDNTFAVPAGGGGGLVNDSVTNAFLANMTADTIKGRITSTGDPQDLTVAQGKTLLGVTPLESRVTFLETASADTANRPWVYLDDFTGTTDDAKLTAALSYSGSQTYTPTIMLSNVSPVTNGAYSFATIRHPFPGLHISGPPFDRRYSPQLSNTRSRGVCEITLTFNSSSTLAGWFHCEDADAVDGKIWNVSFSNLSFRDLGGGTANPSFLTQQTNNVTWWELSLHNIAAYGMFSLLGTNTRRLNIDGAVFSGPGWTLNTWWDTCLIHIGGADCVLWPEGCEMDGAVGPTNAKMLWLDHLTKSTIGPLYQTVRDSRVGIWCDGAGYNTGGGNNGVVQISPGLRCEGVNAGAPMNGELVRITGGQLHFNQTWFGHAMANPGATGRSPLGAIHMTGGKATFSQCVYDHTTGQAESVPFIYAGGTSHVDVNQQSVGAMGGVWTGLPHVQDATSGTVRLDSSVTLV